VSAVHFTPSRELKDVPRYNNAHGILLAFDVSDRKSFEHVSSVWLPHAKAGADPRAPLVLVALKADLPDAKRTSRRLRLRLRVRDCLFVCFAPVSFVFVHLLLTLFHLMRVCVGRCCESR
jgi:GTPase SAR1 family protein